MQTDIGLEAPPEVPRIRRWCGMDFQTWAWVVVGLLTIAAVVFTVAR